MLDKILNCENITVCYKNNKIIENLSFSVQRGDFFLILGKNGAGKSTLLKAILALKDITNGIIEKKFKFCGYMSQEVILNKDFPSTIYEFVLSARSANKLFFNSIDKKIVKQKLESLNLWEIKDKSLTSLSIGQRQRVLLCRSLCISDKIIFLDEPTNSLDIKVREDLYKLLKTLNDKGLTIVMVTHDKEAFKYANKALVLSDKAKIVSDVYDSYQKGDIKFD